MAAEWISVSDRLPEAKTPVLVTYLGVLDQRPYCDAIANINYGGWCWYEDDIADNDEEVKVIITHWMPLPEPPIL